MRKNSQGILSCVKCFSNFGNYLTKFNTKFAFNLHAATVHEKDKVKSKTFKCNSCHHEYSNRGNLNRHIASVHEGKKPFKCDFCDYRCYLKSAMKRHVASVHERNKPFKCDFCNYRCTEKSYLKRHVVVVHEDLKKTH